MTIPHRRNIEYLIKRVFDVGVSLLGLAVLSPLMLGISIAIRCTSHGPVLYWQQRIGLNGKPFTMLKFRSMTNRADETSAWTAKNDPRRTGIGIWLRRYSLDELPQLFNVLRGSMSLVGPRPEQPIYAKRFAATIPEYELREINGGEWEGRAWAELPLAFPESYEKWTKHMADFTAPYGDSMCDVWKRMTEALARIERENRGKTVAVVSHGCALRNFLCFVEFGDAERLGDVGWADNTAVSCVQYDTEKGWSLVFKNDSSHLPEALSTLRTSHWNQYDKK